MEGIFNGLLTTEFAVFCVVVWIATLLVRRITEMAAGRIKHIIPDKYEPYWADLWRERILPALPIGLGGLIAWLVEAYPYPEVFAASDAGRVFLGLTAGVVSGHVYRLLKKRAPDSVKETVDKIEETITGEEGNENPEE